MCILSNFRNAKQILEWMKDRKEEENIMPDGYMTEILLTIVNYG